jgi:hypothetical protein
MEFVGFGKIPRLFRDIVITEKIDGTNGQICITDDGLIYAGSRKRWLNEESDNHGFARWVFANQIELIEKLGPGHHFGEWWGQGINRGYGLKEKRFSLFNVAKWGDPNVRPLCCHVVPVLWAGLFHTADVQGVLDVLRVEGSKAVPGFMNPEGIVVYHTAGNNLFKVTIERDDSRKGDVNA